MNILHIMGKDTPHGGGPIAMLRLHEGLLAAGIGSRIACPKPTRPESVALPRMPWLEGMLGRVAAYAGLSDLDRLGVMRLTQLPAFQEADVVHLHGLHGGFFSTLALPWLSRHKPLVYTLHDMWPLTGHCAVPYDCPRWQTGCGACPYPSAPPALPTERDTTRLAWHVKRWVARHTSMTLIALSTRMMHDLKQSLLAELPAWYIPHGIDTSVYAPRNQNLCRMALGLPQDRPLVLFTAAHLERPEKGGAVLLAALEGLPLPLREAVLLVLMGQGGYELTASTDLDVRHLETVSGATLQALVYSAADVTVVPSFGESFGNVVLESMACGTPVVASDVGGIPDLVRPWVTGLLTPPGNAGDLRHHLKLILTLGPWREKMGHAAREIAVQEYPLEREVARHVALYEHVSDEKGE